MRGVGGLHLGAGGSVRAQAMINNLKTNLFITDGSIDITLFRPKTLIKSQKFIQLFQRASDMDLEK